MFRGSVSDSYSNFLSLASWKEAKEERRQASWAFSAIQWLRGEAWECASLQFWT